MISSYVAIGILIALICVIFGVSYYLYKKGFDKKKLLAISSGLLIVLGGAGTILEEGDVGGEIITVGTGGGYDYTTISAALAYSGLGPGDTIKVHAGTYSGRLQVLDSGSDGLPITITDDGSGEVIIDDSSNTVPQYHGLVDIGNDAAQRSHLVFRNLTFQNCYYEAIRTGWGNFASTTHDITIYNCKFNHIGPAALYFWQENPHSYNPPVYIANITISHCTFTDIQYRVTLGETITIRGVMDVSFDNNTMSNFRKIGIQPNDYVNVVIENNTMNTASLSRTADNAESLAIYPDGGQIDGVCWGNHCIVQNNYIYDYVGTTADSWGLIGIINEKGGTSSWQNDTTVVNNIIYSIEDGANGILMPVNYASLYGYTHYYNITIKFNTIVLPNGYADFYCTVPSSYLHNIIIANNIFASTTTGLDYCMRSSSASSTYYKIYNNLFYRGGSTAYTSFPDQATSYTGNSGRTGDPKFVGGTTFNSADDLDILLSSPAVDYGSGASISGISLAYGYDYEMTDRPIDGDGSGVSQYDIGAYEFGTSVWSNTQPTFGAISPANGDGGVSLYPQLTVSVTDPNVNQTLTVDWYYSTTAGGTAIHLQTNTSAATRSSATETFRLLSFIQASSYYTTYYWFVTVEDINGVSNVSSVTPIGSRYSFTTITSGTSYSAVVRTNGVDYFTWMGPATQASTIDSVISGFDESEEYIAIWDSVSWSDADGLWSKYYGDGHGTDWTISTFDVVSIYLQDSVGTTTIYMDISDTTDYNAQRVLTVMNMPQGLNRGVNFTGFTPQKTITTLSGVAGTITGLATGEVVAFWDQSTPTAPVWRAWIVNFTTTDYVIEDRDVIYTKVGGSRTFTIG